MSDEGEFVVYIGDDDRMWISGDDGFHSRCLGVAASFAEITAAIATLKEDEDV